MLLNARRMRALLQAQGIDALVATSPENVTYASGYWALSQWIRRGPQTYVLLPQAGPEQGCIVASTSLLDLLADQEIWIDKIKRFGYFSTERAESELPAIDRRQAELYALPDSGTALEALAASVAEAGLGRGKIAVDEIGLFPGHWEQLQKKLPQATLVPGASLFTCIRAVKTPQEISRLRTAAQITERSIQAALRHVRAGVTEKELAVPFHQQGIIEESWPVLGCIGFGSRSAMPNVQPSDTQLRHGDVIRFDVGGRYKHYRADIARIAVFGAPSERVERYHRALHAGVHAGLDMIKPGIKASDVFKTVMATVQREGIPHYRRSHVGHGIGLDGYDSPHLTESSTDVIEEGMVMCVETPYYELGWCGLQVEDTVVVTAQGIESFMKTDGRLVKLR
jgi:Xaa-Pro dipeptidase